MALSVMFSTRLCNQNCCSAHTDHTRDHLPLVLMRGTHKGNKNGSIPPNHGPNSNGDIWPRYQGHRPIERWEVAEHGDMRSHCPTQFSSFTTWRGLSSRIDYWKNNGVQGIRVHLVLTLLLPSNTEIYTATGLRNRFSLELQPYFEEEYLVRGPLSSDAIVSSLYGDGQDVLLAIPLFGFRYPFPPIDSDEYLVGLPAGFFPGDGEKDMKLVTQRLAREGDQDHRRRILLDAFTRGKFFAVADLKKNT
ncbi:hypothetical protein N7488_002379 [Penicillium malachiteum]|nr:hypothetical protein N7488_002379 [Penicillium malachiteum]